MKQVERLALFFLVFLNFLTFGHATEESVKLKVCLTI